MQIQKTQTGGTITWDYDDFTSGLIPQGSSGNSTYPLKYNGINGFSTAKNVDQDYLNGCLSQGYAPNSNATNANLLRGNLMSANSVSNGRCYGIDAGAYVHSISNTGTSVTINSDATFPHLMTFAAGNTPVGQDTILYRHNYGGTTLNSIFYSGYNSNNWNVGICTNTFAVFEDNFMSNTPATPLDITTAGGDGKDAGQRSLPHPMEIGSDAILYMGSGRYIHGYDGNTGTNGTFYSKVLTLPEGSIVVAMRKFQDSLLIAVNFDPNFVAGYSGGDNSNAAFVYKWNYLDLDVTSVIDTEEVQISAITIWKGNPVFFASGVSEANGTYKLKVISGNSVLTLASYDGGLPPNRGIITSTTAVYFNCSNGLYRIGSKFKSGYMVSRYGSRTATYDYPGAFVLLGTDWMFNSGSTTNTGSGSTYYAMNINSFDAAYCKFPNVGNLFPSGKRGRIKYMEVEYQSPIAGSGGMTLKISTDTNTVITTVLSAVTTVTGNLLKRYTRDSSNNTLPTFSNLDVSVEWAAGTGPIISRMMLEYELLEITN